jgi:hypothetical protein
VVLRWIDWSLNFIHCSIFTSTQERLSFNYTFKTDARFSNSPWFKSLCKAARWPRANKPGQKDIPPSAHYVFQPGSEIISRLAHCMFWAHSGYRVWTSVGLFRKSDNCHGAAALKINGTLWNATGRKKKTAAKIKRTESWRRHEMGPINFECKRKSCTLSEMLLDLYQLPLLLWCWIAIARNN